MEKSSRRDFLRKALAYTVSAPIGITMAGSTLVSVSRALSSVRKEQKRGVTEDEEIKKEYASEGFSRFDVSERYFGNNMVKFGAVAHTRATAIKYYSEVEDIVNTSSHVVIEGNFTNWDSDDPSYFDNNSYFSTVASLAHRHDKPVITIDSQSDMGVFLEFLMGSIGGMEGTLSLHSLISGSLSRKSTIKKSITTGLGSYLFSSSLLNSMYLRSKIWKGAKIPEYDMFLYNHIVDQRNVQLARRLPKLVDKLPNKELDNGDHVFVTLGETHVTGLNKYLDNPFLCNFKNAVYSPTYNRIDSNEIVRYDPKGTGWTRTEINI